MLLIALVLLGKRIGIVSLKSLRIALVLLAVMVGLTGVSQFGIIPKMETYRIAAGWSGRCGCCGRSLEDGF